MDRLRGLFGGKSSTKATEAEIEVVRRLTAGEDPRLKLIAAQLKRAPEVKRERPSPTEFRVAPTSTFEDITFPLELQRVESDYIAVTDEISGRTLECRIVVGRHGVLTGLECRTTDARPWPNVWRPAPAVAPANPFITLPSLDEQRIRDARIRRALEAWISARLPIDITFATGATEAAISAREHELGGVFPAEYRRFVSITDGLVIQGFALYGLHDIYRLDDLGVAAVVIAWDADDRDEFVVSLHLGGADETVYRMDVHEAEPTPVSLGSSLSAYVRARIGKG